MLYHTITKFSILIILFLGIVQNGFSIEQTSDLLIIDNDTIYLKSFPLETLNLEYRPFGYTHQTAPGTKCWREYQAVWRIKNDTLYLEKIIRCRYDTIEYGKENLTKFFDENEIKIQFHKDLIYANWFTDIFKKYQRSIA